MECARELPLWALHAHGVIVDLHVDTRWDDDREATDAAHSYQM
jgi:hypothetical protein